MTLLPTLDWRIDQKTSKSIENDWSSGQLQPAAERRQSGGA